MRILMVCPQFSPLIGGYERSAERLSGELCRHGNEVMVITERRDNAWPKKETKNGFTIIRLPCIYRPGLHIVTSLISFAFYFLFSGWKYQVFHVHQYGYHAALAIFFSKIMCRPTVLKLTNTGDHGLCKTLNAHNLISRLLLVFLHKQIDACIATSLATKQEALSFGICEERLYLLGNGVNTKEFLPCINREKLAKKQNLHLMCQQLVIYVGRLNSGKNPLGLLEAWSRIKVEFPKAMLVFVGDGPLFSLLKKRIVTLGCEDSVALVGAHLNVLKWYQAADLYVLPSNHEGFSNSLLESMSCGLPVVSTRVSGVEDVFEKANIGAMVEVGDIAGLATGIKNLLSDPVRRTECGARSRILAEKRYSIEFVTREILTVYKRLYSH